jgi:hypothetical protein
LSAGKIRECESLRLVPSCGPFRLPDCLQSRLDCAVPVAFNTTVAVVYLDWRPAMEEGEAKILIAGAYLRSVRPRIGPPPGKDPTLFKEEMRPETGLALCRMVAQRGPFELTLY